MTGGTGRASDCERFSDRNLKRFSADDADAAKAELAADADDADDVALGT